MFITYTKYHPNTIRMTGYNEDPSFASWYGSVMFTCQLPDGMTETRILQEVLHMPGSLDMIKCYERFRNLTSVPSVGPIW
jgi:hypothetical protein